MSTSVWITAKGREKPISDLSDKRLAAILKQGECDDLSQFEALLKEARKRGLPTTDAILRDYKNGRWCEVCEGYHY